MSSVSNRYRDTFLKYFPDAYEVSDFFWSVTLKEGKTYTEKMKYKVHVSMAALEPNSDNGEDGPVCVMFKVNSASRGYFCLSSDITPQQPLNLDFNVGEEVTACLKGNGIVHLTGFIIQNNEIFHVLDSINSQYEMYIAMRGEVPKEESDVSGIVHLTGCEIHDEDKYCHEANEESNLLGDELVQLNLDGTDFFDNFVPVDSDGPDYR